MRFRPDVKAVVIILSAFLVFFGQVPGNVSAQSWKPIGPEGGDVIDIIVDPLGGQTVFAAVGGSVFRSQNQGVLWERFSTGLPDVEITDLALDSDATPNVLYASTRGAGIYRRALPGTRWLASNLGLGDLDVKAVVINPYAAISLVAATERGIFKSNDGGSSWSDISGIALDRKPITAVAIDPTSGNIYAAVAGEGIFKSGNDGDLWEPLNDGLADPDLLIVTFLIVNPVNSAVLMATENAAIFRLQGATWEAFDEGLVFHLTLVTNVRRIAIDSTNFFYYAATKAGVFKRGFTGLSWEYLNNGPHRLTETVAVNPVSPSTLFAGTVFFGIFKSEDGGANWFLSNKGIFATRIRKVVFNPENPLIIHAACFGGGVWSSHDGGENWEASSEDIDEMSAFALAIDTITPETLFVGTREEGVFQSLDEGGIWTNAGSGLPANVPILALVVNPLDSSVLYCVVSGNGLFKRTLPDAWVGIAGLPTTVTNIAINGFDSDILLSTTDGNGVYRSIDAGATWTAANGGLDSGESFLSVVFDPADSDIAFIGGNGAPIFKSDDGGQNWVFAGTGLPASPVVNDIIFNSDGELFSALDGKGVYRSTDGGNQWTLFSDGLTNLHVNALAANPNDASEVLAATEGGGIFKLSADETTDRGGEGPSSLCFIATAAYGTPFAREVVTLRQFRDKCLMPHFLGRVFVTEYYRLSPPLANYIAGHPLLRGMTRALLHPLVLGCRAYMFYPDAPARLVMLLVLGMLPGIFLVCRKLTKGIKTLGN